ncbi:MAG: phosphate ABC transporter substrate-binding protein PstS [Thermogemmatispora sp.]|jgi:phosphate transport system substrate-binding protein|uniref:Phosphate-binding protein n=1 Tax=Thermogemmatispora aurantia TaxID=2045279 RepID=A0A5J4K4H2_9CHLR|nr:MULTISPECIES: phosphate ABC transporter substrate-binding protein PstS [Thermogemmatispora]MBE3565573.1 phosphate ABC transporter substrate-binding protein PstS [Thermogemmatispora sp.]GER81962.1 phosphate-binding protein [Thermogemmatispora aurantia]
MTPFTPSLRHRGRPRLRYLGALLLLGLLALLAACGNSNSSSGGTTTGSGSTCPSTKQLTGAGSTFDNPLFSKMFQEYPKVKCGINVNYQAVGSGAGINNLLQHIVDFGATDAPMTNDQLNKSTSGPILHIPITIGAVAISYNLSGVSQLKLTGPILAAIYEGKITTWDDPQIKAINSGLNLPHKNITVVHRSDGSGTTSIFTHYLSAVSPDWQSKVGAGTTVNWPTGVGAKGSSGVAGQVKNTDGAIGYVELSYVLANNIPYALLQNAAGKFVAPSLDSAKADAESFSNIPADLRFYIVNGSGDNAYPITGFSWVVVYQNQSNSDKGQALARLLWWMVHDGQQYAQTLNYVPLPDTIVSKDEAQIKAMRCGSSACYSGS